MLAGVSVSDSKEIYIPVDTVLICMSSLRLRFVVGNQYVFTGLYTKSSIYLFTLIIIVAPSLVKNGLAFGESISNDFPLVSYMGLSFDDPSQYITAPSPRYWLLWPGVLMMLLYSVLPKLSLRVLLTDHGHSSPSSR